MSRNFGHIAAVYPAMSAIASLLLGCNAHTPKDTTPVEVYTGTEVVMVDYCFLPSTIDGVEPCITYARCCGFDADVPSASCAHSVGTCECSYNATEKVRCDDTSRGVACTCY